jgi:hypothetical protein
MLRMEQLLDNSAQSLEQQTEDELGRASRAARTRISTVFPFLRQTQGTRWVPLVRFSERRLRAPRQARRRPELRRLLQHLLLRQQSHRRRAGLRIHTQLRGHTQLRIHTRLRRAKSSMLIAQSRIAMVGRRTYDRSGTIKR